MASGCNLQPSGHIRIRREGRPWRVRTRSLSLLYYLVSFIQTATFDSSLEKFRLERENEMFPDEVDTPTDQAARIRFQRYSAYQNQAVFFLRAIPFAKRLVTVGLFSTSPKRGRRAFSESLSKLAGFGRLSLPLADLPLLLSYDWRILRLISTSMLFSQVPWFGQFPHFRLGREGEPAVRLWENLSV